MSERVTAASPDGTSSSAPSPALSGPAGEVAPNGRFSLATHAVALSVVVMLYGSLLSPLNSRVVLMGCTVIVAVGLLRSLARNGVVAWRTLLLALLIALFVAFRAHYDPPVTAYGQTKWVNFCTTTLASMAAAAAVFDRRSLRALALWWVAVGTVLAALTVAGPGAANGRAQVDGSNPVWLGRAIGASMVVTVWVGASGLWRWWRVIPLVLLLGAGLLATGSRGPAVAMVLGVLVLLLAPTARRSRQVLWVGIVGGGALLLAPLVPIIADSRFGRFVAEGDVDGESRTDMWTSGVRAIPDHPLGAGLGEWSHAATSTFDWPHNIFIEVFIEQGWLVGLLLVGLVLAVIRRLWRQSGNDPTLQLALALLVTETVHVSTSGDLNARTFFFVLLLGVSLLNKQRFQGPSAAASDEEKLPRTALPAR